MDKKSKSVNAGIHAINGFDFQKYCAIYILLDNFEEIKSKKYFIILEHHDDLIFGYSTSEGKLELINAYQAKKSTNFWTINMIYGILKKLILNGNSLRVDEIEKESHYSHNLHFVTNNSISLKVIKSKKTERLRITRLINEEENVIEYTGLEQEIKNDIEENVKNLLSSDETPFLQELKHVSFRYIDFAKTSKSQRQQLIGMFNEIFGNTVYDHKAAVETLFMLFSGREGTYNQGRKARLDDSSKRIESSVVNETINIITNKTRAYELWRKKDEGISGKLKLSLEDQKDFKIHFESSFDQFKDLTQVEHQKIRSFVSENKDELKNHIKDEDCIETIYNKFKLKHNSQLSELQIKAAIFAAYIELKG